MTAHITYQSTCLATCSGSQGALSASASGLLPPSSSGPHAGSALPSAPGPMYPGPASQDSSHGPPGQGVDLQHQWQASHWAPHHQAPGIPSPPSLVILPHVTALTPCKPLYFGTFHCVIFWQSADSFTASSFALHLQRWMGKPTWPGASGNHSVKG